MTDDEIWEDSLKNNKVILTKDTDFYSKSISSVIVPKVIWFQLGNMTLSELHNYFEVNWEMIMNHLNEANLIIAKKNQINVIY